MSSFREFLKMVDVTTDHCCQREGCLREVRICSVRVLAQGIQASAFAIAFWDQVCQLLGDSRRVRYLPRSRKAMYIAWARASHGLHPENLAYAAATPDIRWAARFHARVLIPSPPDLREGKSSIPPSRSRRGQEAQVAGKDP